MSKTPNSKIDESEPPVYEIRIEGHLGSQWTDWFEGLTITLEENGDTLITGPVTDQAALYGLLKKVRDLGMPLLSVNRVQYDEIHQNHSKKLLENPSGLSHAKGRSTANETRRVLTVDSSKKE